ncbi:hypothetical protein MSHI_33550 [Mycobacterium shinjukuense]|uniref:Uncharacterized protein n=1 Tax=Mycobacterium shinjukuense TaxID=398694 RepID=A0A7I7MW62_9MYCO|nr:hypothetical protein MSHI_33550 [Mycobacterium shinjukuense]
MPEMPAPTINTSTCSMLLEFMRVSCSGLTAPDFFVEGRWLDPPLATFPENRRPRLDSAGQFFDISGQRGDLRRGGNLGVALQVGQVVGHVDGVLL